MLEVQKTRNLVQMVLKGLDFMMQVVHEGLDILIKQTSLILSLRYFLRYSVFLVSILFSVQLVVVIPKMLKLDLLQIFQDEMDQFAPDIQVNTFFSP